MKKKFFTVALATTIALGSSFSIFAGTTSSLTTTGFAANTGKEDISGDFDVTYTFHEVAGELANSFLVELRDGDNNCIDARSDNWGWTYTAEDGVVVFTDNQKKITRWPSAEVTNDGWAYIAQQREEGADVVADIKRIGDIFYFEFTESNASGPYVTWTYTIEFPVMKKDTTITITSGGEKEIVLTNIKFVNNKVDTSDVTSDVTTYAQYKKVAEDNYTVRVVSEVSISESEIDTLNRVGFRCSRTASNAGDKYLGKNIYKAIKANGETKTAADGKYFVVLEITNVKSDAILYVQPLSEKSSAVDSFGKEVTVNMKNILK